MEELMKDAKFFGRKVEGGDSKSFPRLRDFIKGPIRMLAKGALIAAAAGATIIYGLDFFCSSSNNDNKRHDNFNRGNRR